MRNIISVVIGFISCIIIFTTCFTLLFIDSNTLNGSTKRAPGNSKGFFDHISFIWNTQENKPEPPNHDNKTPKQKFSAEKAEPPTGKEASKIAETNTVSPNDIETSLVPSPSDSGKFYVVIKNKTGKIFKGIINLTDVQGLRETDKEIYVSLNPREAKFILGNGSVEKDIIRPSISGEYNESLKKYDASLDYTIVKTERVGSYGQGHGFYWIYTTANTEETYIAISKELKANYGGDYAISIFRFAPILINPTNNDSVVIFSKNDVLGFSRVAFYNADDTYSKYQEAERKIVNI